MLAVKFGAALDVVGDGLDDVERAAFYAHLSHVSENLQRIVGHI